MGRIALFVLVIGGAAYFVVDVVAARVFGTILDPVMSVSIAILVAVGAWTALIWWAGDRFGRGADGDRE